jgi:hypothetical protein
MRMQEKKFQGNANHLVKTLNGWEKLYQLKKRRFDLNQRRL